MLVRQLFNHSTFGYTYLVADPMSHEAVLIDPVKEKVRDYVQLFKELGLTAVAAIDTHHHDDHTSGIGALAQLWGCEAIVGAPNDVIGQTRQVEDEDIIPVGDMWLKVIHTPGHTEDSYCFRLDQPGKSMVFTGDTLLVRTVGLSNQPTSNPRMHYDSLFNVLAKLADDILVYPGRDFKGCSISTIGEEKRFNPYLLAKDINAFLALKKKQKPADIQPQVARNKGADKKIKVATSASTTTDKDDSATNAGGNNFYIPGETRSPDAAAPQKHGENEDAVKNKAATDAADDAPAPLDDSVGVPSWR
jgi:glyoxylase-like metal-dependent hydrolase (beta-lactamase superfamily II)